MSQSTARIADEPVWPAVFAGLCASLVGIGLARFAYTPLIPALIGHHWFTPSQAGYLGATNFAGYLAGALAASRLAGLPIAPLMRAMMVLASVAFIACSAPGLVAGMSFPWFSVWRFAAGVAGGVLMVLAAPGILRVVPVARRGLASGVIFTGIGLGIAASGLLVPPLLEWGLTTTWLALGGIAGLLTIAAWAGWPPGGASTAPVAPGGVAHAGGRALWAVVVAYGLNAVGLVPHMVFIVDYVARGLDRGLAAGALCWVAFGLGAVAGAVATGAMADRIGFVAAFRLALVVQAATVAVPLVSNATPALLASAAIAGMFTPGIVVLMLGRVHLLAAAGSAAARAGWRLATIAWAVGQAAAAYAFSYLFGLTGQYWPLFAIGCVALLLALGVDVLAGPGREADTPRAPRSPATPLGS